MRVDEFLSRLERVKRQGDGWIASCPTAAHPRGDRNPGLKVDVGQDDEILLKCHKGCDTADIVAAVGLELKDLFPEREQTYRPRTIETTYDYVDEQGELLYQVVRYNPKGFSQRRPDGQGGWIDKLDDVRRVLYRLPELLYALENGKAVWIVEGEKDADALAAAGVCATTNVGGAQAWRAEYTELLAGAPQVVIIADRDGPGIKRAQKLAAELEDKVGTVRIGQAAAGKDAYDHLEAGYGLSDFEPLDPEKKANGLVLERFSSIQAVAPEWVNGLEGFVPFKAITLLAGEQGTNKSTFACYLASLITGPQYEGDVMYITTEGDPGVEIKPRLLAAGADVDRCHFVRRAVDGFEGIVSFPNDIRELEAEVKRTGTRLIVIDPVLAHVDVEDTNNDNSIRTALAPLQMMAQRNDLIVLLVAHINKDKSTDPFKRVGGSKGLTGVARSNLMMGKLFDGHELRAIASFKSSWADPANALTFRINSEFVPEIDGFSIRCSPFGTSPVKASSLLSEKRSEQ